MSATLSGVSNEELRQLDATRAKGVWPVFGRDIRVSNLDKVLFPVRPGEDPVRKRDLDPGQRTSWEDVLVLARLDYTQNAINKTLVAPYSPRACAGATVSAPIDWDELDDPDLRPGAWTIRTIAERIAVKGDRFRDVLEHPQHLPSLT